MREGITESDEGRRSFDQFAGTRGFEHAGLGGHYGRLFYTAGEKEHRSKSAHSYVVWRLHGSYRG